LSFIIGAIKIIVLLGFLIIIHEGGHFLVAKFCKVKVREFSIGFGPEVHSWQGTETKYTIRWIPFGGYVDMLGESERDEAEESFSKASIPKRIAIVVAGATVNIIFGLIVFFILACIAKQDVAFAFEQTGKFILNIFDSIKIIFTGKMKMDQLVGPVGISEMVVKTNGLFNFIYLMSLVSVSLGVTNLLPIPALDGGKILILIIEWIRRKPLKEEVEIKIQMIGLTVLLLFSLYITYKDILRIF
jgi:regulator of sigma E protease